MPVYSFESKVNAILFMADDIGTAMIKFKLSFPEEKVMRVEQYFPDSPRGQRGWHVVFRAEDEK